MDLIKSGLPKKDTPFILDETDDNAISNIRILYVEDDSNERDSMLQSLGYYFRDISTADSGEKGLAMFSRIKPDLVISDLRMPKMNGLEMAREIHALNTGVPIIITSANSDLNELIEAVESGILHYLIKPVSIEDLLAAIKKSLQNTKRTKAD